MERLPRRRRHVQKAPQSRSITLTMSEGKLASLSGVVAALVLGAGAPALAAPMLQNILPFGDNRGAQAPPVARYVGSQGQSFVLDRASGAQALLKFDDDPEVWALDASPGPGGATIYRNDAGTMVLRITKLGGLTLFTAQEPEGMPVSMLGEADTLGMSSSSVVQPSALLQRMIQASARASRAAQHLVAFDAPAVTPQSSALVSDAVVVTVDALARLSRRSEARPFLSRLDKVSFIVGPRPDVVIAGPVMTVTVTPGKGFAGRPSSDRLAKAALRR